MTSRPLRLLCTAVLALGALGAAGCGDSSEPEDQNAPAASTNGAEASTAEDSQSDNSTSSKPTSEGITFGQKSATGVAAIAQAQGTIDNPEIIRLRVRAQPAQNAMVSYTLICVSGGKAGGDSGQFTEMTPIDREIKIPNRKPTECNVSANAKLDVGSPGKVTMKLRGRER